MEGIFSPTYRYLDYTFIDQKVILTQNYRETCSFPVEITKAGVTEDSCNAVVRMSRMEVNCRSRWESEAH